MKAKIASINHSSARKEGTAAVFKDGNFNYAFLLQAVYLLTKFSSGFYLHMTCSRCISIQNVFEILALPLFGSKPPKICPYMVSE